MIHVSQLGEDYFVYDQASQSLVGQNRGQAFSLGDEVKIQVASVNLEERKIDFQLVQQLTHLGRVIRQKHRVQHQLEQPLQKKFLARHQRHPK